MQGRRGKCHACGNVFPIELRIAEQISDNSVAEVPRQTPASSPSSFDNIHDELTLDEPPKPAKVSSERASSRSATSAGTVVSKASRSELPPIQFNCTSCRGRMEVPGEAAQQLTHCPHCKRQLTIPAESEPSPEALAANDPWADLSPLGPAPIPMQQTSPFGDTLYPPPTAMSSMSPLPPSGRRRGNDPTQHIVCGIFISLFALIAVAIEIYEIVIYTIIFVAAGSSNPVATTVSGWIIAVCVFLLILSILQLIGGISLARRTGINLARTGVVICCLPCFCLINIAFGIWGCLLVFGNNAERDFR
ncbi:MAG: hypothetical protein SFV81_03830 [Pirellulaceae bacterium]|nr:hypothetical protein [Pirellulaceae bacterium]